MTEMSESQLKHGLGGGKASRRGMAKGIKRFQSFFFCSFFLHVTPGATDANTFHSSAQRRGVEPAHRAEQQVREALCAGDGSTFLRSVCTCAVELLSD